MSKERLTPLPPPNKFKNINGLWRTHSLFAEQTHAKEGKESALYTLRPEEWHGFPSLKLLFLETNDPTGYTLSQKHLGGWEHFQALLACKWFEEAFDEWKRELETKMRAEALVNLVKMSKDSSHRSSVELNKFLLNKGWVLPEDKSKGGRPKKEDIRKEAIRLATVDGEVDSDFERVIRGS